MAPGGHTMVGVFAVVGTAAKTQEEVAGTRDEGTWLYIDAVRSLPEGKKVNLKTESRKGGRKDEGRRVHELSVSPLVTQLIAGAPTLAIILQQATAVLGHQVQSCPVIITEQQRKGVEHQFIHGWLWYRTYTPLQR